MANDTNVLRAGLLSGLSTLLCLLGPLALANGIGFLVQETTQTATPGEREWMFPLVVTLELFSGALWGRAIARHIGSDRQMGMLLAGMSSLLPSILLSMGALIKLDEVGFFDLIGINNLETHVGYTIVFVAITFVVAALSSLAVSWVAAGEKAALRIGLVAGLGAAAAFWLVTVAMAAGGVKVDGIRSGIWVRLPPMPVITILGMIAGSLVGGGILGWLLTKEREHA